MAHNLKSCEIRKLYDILYKYEKRLKSKKKNSEVLIPDLMTFLSSNDIYLGVLNRNVTVQAKRHAGYFLYKQSNDFNKCYWLIKHIRDTFAHGGIERKSTSIIFKEKQRTLDGKIPDRLFMALLNILVKAK